MDIHEYLWITMDYYGFSWIAMGYKGSPWITMDHHGLPWMTMVDHGECCMFKGHHYSIGNKIPIPEKCAWLECRFNIKFNNFSNNINKY